MTKQHEEKGERLSVYVRDYCGYCHRVLQAAQQLGIDIAVHNIWQNAEDEQALLNARGRATVPVLKIEREGVEPEWMGESADIVRYLERTGESSVI